MNPFAFCLKQGWFIAALKLSVLTTLQLGSKGSMRKKFDLVMTDICMPGLSGNILARYVRNLREDIPIISVTASPWLVNELFDMVIEKPFNLTFLLDTIAYCLRTEADMPDEHALQLCL